MPLQKDLKKSCPQKLRVLWNIYFQIVMFYFGPLISRKLKSFKCLNLAGNFIPRFLLTVLFFFLGGGLNHRKSHFSWLRRGNGSQRFKLDCAFHRWVRFNFCGIIDKRSYFVVWRATIKRRTCAVVYGCVFQGPVPRPAFTSLLKSACPPSHIQ